MEHGEIANFLMGASYVVAAGAIYKRHKTKKTAWIACVTASFVIDCRSTGKLLHPASPV